MTEEKVNVETESVGTAPLGTRAAGKTAAVPDLVWFESPLEAFPGRLGFPRHLTGLLYRRYVKVLTSSREELKTQDDALVSVVVTLENEDELTPRRYGIIHWRAALALAVVELEGLPAGWDDPSGEGAPVPLFAWVVDCLLQWLEPQLTIKKSVMRSGGT